MGRSCASAPTLVVTKSIVSPDATFFRHHAVCMMMCAMAAQASATAFAAHVGKFTLELWFL